MATDIMQMNSKTAEGLLSPFYPVTSINAVINGMAQKATLVTNTQSITVSGLYQYTAATTNLPGGIATTGYILASFIDAKNGQLNITGTTLSRLLVNGVWGAWVNFGIDTGWMKVQFSAGVSSSDCYIRKIGDVVYFKGWLISPAEKYDIWTIPAEFRPGADVVIVVLKDDSGTSKANLQFNSDGKMRINYNSNLGTRINMGGLCYAI